MPAPPSEGEHEALSEAWAWRQPLLQGGPGGGLRGAADQPLDSGSVRVLLA